MVMAISPAITQNPDIRFLGRLLGEVIRAYGGDKLYRQTEYIRSSSVDRARGVANADVVDPGLDALSLDDTIAFVRGFMRSDEHTSELQYLMRRSYAVFCLNRKTTL